MRSTVVPLAYTIPEAAEAARVSELTIRRAIAAIDPKAFPPPLRAKRVGASNNGKQLILVADLTKWLDSLQDA